MKFLIISALVMCFIEARTLPDDEESSFEYIGTVFHDSNVACEVQGNSLEFCYECDKRYESECIKKSYPGCKCLDLNIRNEGEIFFNLSCLFQNKALSHRKLKLGWLVWVTVLCYAKNSLEHFKECF